MRALDLLACACPEGRASKGGGLDVLLLEVEQGAERGGDALGPM